MEQSAAGSMTVIYVYSSCKNKKHNNVLQGFCLCNKLLQYSLSTQLAGQKSYKKANLLVYIQFCMNTELKFLLRLSICTVNLTIEHVYMVFLQVYVTLQDDKIHCSFNLFVGCMYHFPSFLNWFSVCESLLSWLRSTSESSLAVAYIYPITATQGM